MEVLKRQVRHMNKSHDVLTKVVKNLLDSVVIVEKKLEDSAFTKKCQNDHTNDIEKLMDDNSEAIRKINERISELKQEEDSFKSQIKKCYYHDKGFCKNQIECKFFHSQRVCEYFESEGICPKLNCKDRHPKICRYWKRIDSCYRGQNCLYRHNYIAKNKVVAEGKECDRCKKTAYRYYCENCQHDFCPECIIHDPKHQNVDRGPFNLDCEKMHKPIEVDEAMDVIENATESNQCLCKSEDEERFTCEVCRKVYCKSCPSCPINDGDNL